MKTKTKKIKMTDAEKLVLIGERSKIAREKIKELAAKGAIFYCSHSGGKDSQAMYIWLWNNVPHNQIVVVHADLGKEVEWDGLQEHIANTTSHELNVVKAARSFIEMVRNRKMFPSASYRQCTSDLKTGPIWKFIRQHAKKNNVGIVVNCMGIRAQESGPRSNKLPYSINAKNHAVKTKNKREAYDIMPIFDWTEDELKKYVQQNGQELHWAYKEGMSRLSCKFCIMASVADLRVSARLNPEGLTIIENLEKEIGHTMFGKQKTVNKERTFIPVPIREWIFG